jgi:hypothetical protein
MIRNDNSSPSCLLHGGSGTALLCFTFRLSSASHSLISLGRFDVGNRPLTLAAKRIAINAPHDTEIKPRIYDNAYSYSAYNESSMIFFLRNLRKFSLALMRSRVMSHHQIQNLNSANF